MIITIGSSISHALSGKIIEFAPNIVAVGLEKPVIARDFSKRLGCVVFFENECDGTEYIACFDEGILSGVAVGRATFLTTAGKITVGFSGEKTAELTRSNRFESDLVFAFQRRGIAGRKAENPTVIYKGKILTSQANTPQVVKIT